MELPGQVEPLPSEVTEIGNIPKTIKTQSKQFFTSASLYWVLRLGSCLGTLTIWQSENETKNIILFSILFTFTNNYLKHL